MHKVVPTLYIQRSVRPTIYLYLLVVYLQHSYILSEVTRNLVQRAENAGFKALVLTVDTPFFGLRLADIRNKFTLPPHLK